MLNKIEIEGEIRRELFARYMPDGEFVASIPIYVDNNPESRAYIYVKIVGDLAHHLDRNSPAVGDVVRVTGRLIRENWIRPSDGKHISAYKILAETFEVVRKSTREPKKHEQHDNRGNRRGSDFSRWK